MSAPETANPAASLTCSFCGRNSVWKEVFTQVREGEFLRNCCPRCAAGQQARTNRWEFVGIAFFAAWATFYILQSTGRGAEAITVGFLLFVIVQYPLTILHESGHALAARLLGVPAIAILIGREPWLVDRHFLGVRWRIGLLSSGGLTYHAPCEGRKAVLKDALIAAAGPLTNLLIAVLSYAAAASMTERYEHSLARLALLMVAIASALHFLWNAWPHDVGSAVGPMPSDGAIVLKLLKEQNQQARDGRGLRHWFRASFAFADREFAIAAREAAKARVRTTGPKNVIAISILEAAARSESDDAHGAIDLLRPINDGGIDDPGLRAGVLNNLGWAYLLLDEPDLLETGILLVDEACDIAPWDDTYVTTLACLYAATATPANGRAAEARKFLTTVNLKTTARQNAADAALAQGLCAVAEGDVAAAQIHYADAKSRGSTAAPLRLLERRLASR